MFVFVFVMLCQMQRVYVTFAVMDLFDGTVEVLPFIKLAWIAFLLYRVSIEMDRFTQAHEYTHVNHGQPDHPTYFNKLPFLHI